MLDKLLRRTTFSYAMMLIVNPILILCFQNCTVAKLSDNKAVAQQVETSSAKEILPSSPTQ